MIKNFKIFEAIKWYYKGKLEPDDSVNISEFAIGKKVSATGYGKLIYWNDYSSGDIGSVGVFGEWVEIWLNIEDEEIKDVAYRDVRGYEGTLIKIGYWPWFQTTNFELTEDK